MDAFGKQLEFVFFQEKIVDQIAVIILGDLRPDAESAEDFLQISWGDVGLVVLIVQTGHFFIGDHAVEIGQTADVLPFQAVISHFFQEVMGLAVQDQRLDLRRHLVVQDVVLEHQIEVAQAAGVAVQAGMNA